MFVYLLALAVLNASKLDNFFPGENRREMPWEELLPPCVSYHFSHSKRAILGLSLLRSLGFSDKIITIIWQNEFMPNLLSLFVILRNKSV